MDNYRQDTIFLSERENGNIIKCNCCNCYQISFNNLIISFKEKEFIAFKKTLDSFVQSTCKNITHNGKDVLIRTSDIENLAFAFDRKEFEELLDMVNEAKYMNNIHKIVAESN